MRSLPIFIVSIILHELSYAQYIQTICESQACICNNNSVSCTQYDLDSQFILPNSTKIIYFVDVPTTTIDKNSFTNDKLQNITWISSKIQFVKALHQNYLKYLNLSGNKISQLLNNTFDDCSQLEYIDLSENQLSILPEFVFTHTKMLKTVKLEKNLIHIISENLFKETINLKNLSIGNPNLIKIADNAMSNLEKLEYFSIENSSIVNLNRSWLGKHNNLREILINNCEYLTFIDDDFFNAAPNIENIELKHCSTINFLPSNIVTLSNLKHFQMFGTQIEPNCHNGWFDQWFNRTIVEGYEKYKDFNESIKKINCPAKIYHTSDSITLQLTKKGIINCLVYGNPIPSITWLVPGGLTYHENKEADINISQHPNVHNWDLHEIASQSIITNKNGSLQILRMLRASVGNYTCYASNIYGNDSKIVEVHLDSGVFFNIKINAFLLGIASALGFLMLTILCCVFKLLLIRLVELVSFS